jgi:hypothetical protein
MLLFMYKGIVTPSSLVLAIHAHDIQNSLHSALSKDTTLNAKEPISFQDHTVSQLSPLTHQMVGLVIIYSFLQFSSLVS